MVKVKTTLSISKEILQKAHEENVNISKLLEETLRAYLEGISQPIQQQPAQPSETASQTADPIDIAPAEMIKELQTRLGVKPTSDQLKGIIAALWGIVVELDLVDDVVAGVTV